MNKHRDNKNYIHWSLEKTAMLLTKASSYYRLLNHLLQLYFWLFQKLSSLWSDLHEWKKEHLVAMTTS